MISKKDKGGLKIQGYLKKSFKSKPLISIITVVYNGEKFIEKTIQSVINQTYDNIEYIIVDGASKDSTLSIIKKYEDKIDYWISEEDSGIYDAMNKGIASATGDYIIHINAGDYIDENIIKDIFSIKNITEFSLVIGRIKFLSGKNFVPSFTKKLYLKNTLHHQGTFYSRNLFIVHGFYDLHYKILADYNFNLNIYQSLPNCFESSLNVCVCSDDGVSDKPNLINYLEEIRVRNRYLKNKLTIKIFLAIYSLIKFIMKRLLKTLRVIKI